MLARVRVDGVHVSDELVLELAGRLRREGFEWTAVRLERALMWGEQSVSFTPVDRECVFQVLDDPPAGLVQLRAAVLMARDEPEGVVLDCAECGCVSEQASGWIALLLHDEDEGDSQSVVAYCPPCAAQVLEYEPRATGYI